MARATSTPAEPLHDAPDTLTRVGGWLFKHRTSLPLPIVLTLLIFPQQHRSAFYTTTVAGLGILLVAAGELIRFWAVHHIGAISRTRSDRLGPLIDTGPFALVRNPLYVGNILLWVGFALVARLVWLAPLIVLLLGAEYHAIVRWEESLLVSRLGDAYRDYAARVPRWLPTLDRRARKGRRDKDFSASSTSSAVSGFSWTDTLFSERGTFVAIAV